MDHWDFTRGSYVLDIAKAECHSFANVPSKSNVWLQDKHVERIGNNLYYFNEANEVLEYDTQWFFWNTLAI